MSNREVLISLDFRLVPYTGDYGNLVAYDSHIAITVASGPTSSYTGTGGIVFSGAATSHITLKSTGSGGVVFSGAATAKIALTFSGSGGLVLAGSATTSKTLTFTPSGSIVFGGAANTDSIITETGSGELVFGGSAGFTKTLRFTGSGGIVFGGEAEKSWSITPVATDSTQVFHAPWIKFADIPQIRMRPKGVRNALPERVKKPPANPLKVETKIGDVRFGVRPNATVNIALAHRAVGPSFPVKPSADVSFSIRYLSDEQEIADIIACLELEEELCHA